MKKSTLVVSIVFTVLGLINGVTLIVLDCTNVFDATMQSYVLLCAFLILVWVPLILEKVAKTNLNFSLIIAYEIFLILSLLVGSMWGVYKLPIYYDKFNHLLSGVLFCFIFYSLFGEERSKNVGALWLFLLTFFVSMATGGIWEICEFTIDSLLGGNTQRWQGFAGREVLFDTMFDLICDFVGAIVGTIIVLVIYNKKRKNSKINQQN